MMQYDLMIVGGGLVGASLALALQSSSLRIALIEAKTPRHDDPRLFGLNYSSCCFLKNMGVFHHLLPHATLINQVHVSRQGQFGALRLDAKDVRLPYLGYVIPARFVEEALYRELSRYPHLDVFCPAKVMTLEQDDHVTLTMTTADGEKTCSAPLVVAADGSDSTMRKLLHIESDIKDYHQSAIVTITTLQRHHEHIAYERFNRDGAIAMLPLNEQSVATIVTVNDEKVLHLNALSNECFLQYLQKTFGYRLGRFEKISQRSTFPLRSLTAKSFGKKNVFLLGNALHTLHPIAAQGFNLALYEVAKLTESVLATLKTTSIKAIDLKSISDRMQKQQMMSMRMSHHLALWFSKHSFLLNMALQFGMISLDVCAPFKRKLLTSMMGRIGETPRLLLDMMSYGKNIES